MADLYTIEEFASYMQQDVDTSSATVARRVASGWLKWATGLTDFTAPVDDQLFTWGLELGAIAFRNPDGVTSESTDDHQSSWDKTRRMEILDAARSSTFGGGGGPRYTFPAPDWHWQVVPAIDPLTV